jgi:hypothetical protein
VLPLDDTNGSQGERCELILATAVTYIIINNNPLHIDVASIVTIVEGGEARWWMMTPSSQNNDIVWRMITQTLKIISSSDIVATMSMDHS